MSIYEHGGAGLACIVFVVVVDNIFTLAPRYRPARIVGDKVNSKCKEKKAIRKGTRVTGRHRFRPKPRGFSCHGRKTKIRKHRETRNKSITRAAEKNRRPNRGCREKR